MKEFLIFLLIVLVLLAVYFGIVKPRLDYIHDHPIPTQPPEQERWIEPESNWLQRLGLMCFDTSSPGGENHG